MSDLRGSDNPLVQAIEHALARLGAEPLAALEDGVTIGYEELELRVLWDDLATLVARESAPLWPHRIEEHLVEMAAGARAMDDDPAVVTDRCLPLVLSREGARGLAGRAADVLVYPFVGDLIVAVGFRAEAGWRYALRAQLDTWGLQGAVVLKAALENLRKLTRAEMIQAMDGPLQIVDGGDGFDSARLLILDELTDEARACGLIAAAPARDVLAFVPFNQAGLPHLRALVNLAANAHRRWPQPISPDLLYVAPNTALPIPVDLADDGTPRLQLPPELGEVQARLMREGRW